MLPIMLQLYNVRNELADDFDGTLEQVAAAGYSSVELALAPAYHKTSSEFKASLDKAGLAAVSAHVPYQDMLRDPEKVMEFHIEIGCTYIVIPFLAEEDRSSGPNYEQVKRSIAALGETANKLGAVLLYHNHEFEFADYNGKYALDDLYDSIPPHLLQTEIDVCWAKVGGVDPAEYIRKYKGRAPVVHLKDFASSQDGTVKAGYNLIGQGEKARQNEAFPFRAVGYGVQNIPLILSAALEAGAQWLVVEQDLPTPGKTPLECAKDSLTYLKGLE